MMRVLRLQVPLAIYLLFTLVPFYWMVLYAVRPDGTHSLVPWPLTLANFRTVWNGLGFGVFFRNSLLVGVGTLLCTGVLALLGGYAMARFRFRGRGALLLGLLCSQFVPGVMLLIPLFVLFRHLGLLDNLDCLVLADTAFQLPLSLLLMSGFIANIPVELEEAALVDGCSDFSAMWYVSARIVVPGVVTVALFAFLTSWNEFLAPLFILQGGSSYTLPIMLVNIRYASFNILDVGALQAGIVVAMVPCLLVYLALQRFYVSGLIAGALRG